MSIATRKKVSLILLAVMLVVAFTGCASGNASVRSNPTSVEAAGTVSTDEDNISEKTDATATVFPPTSESAPEIAVWPPPTSELPSEPTPEVTSAQTPVPTSMPEPTATPTSTSQLTQEPTPTSDIQYVNLVLNSNPDRMRAHLPDCRDVPDIAPENRINFNGTIEEAKAMGYVSCGHCHPW